MAYRDLPGLLILPFGLILYFFGRERIAPIPQILSLPLTLAAAAWVPVVAWLSVEYLTMPGYYDHVESTIAAVAWWHHRGHPLYPSFDGSEGFYGLLYGHFCFRSRALRSPWLRRF